MYINSQAESYIVVANIKTLLGMSMKHFFFLSSWCISVTALGQGVDRRNKKHKKAKRRGNISPIEEKCKTCRNKKVCQQMLTRKKNSKVK